MKKFILLSLVVSFLGSCSTTQKNHNSLSLIQTSKSGDNLTQKKDIQFTAKSASNNPTITVDTQKKYQQIIGFGGAFTESSASVIDKLSPKNRQKIINAYFSPDQAGYTLTRTHINSCDFSLSNYAYANVEGDTKLEHFSIKEDMDDLIPFIKDAMAVPGASFEIVASPWTAPPWMKTNNDWNDGSLKPEYYATWALYFSKYLKAYKDQGINIWGVTVENEPLGNGGQWESMVYTPQQMTDFVKNHLGPQLEKDDFDTKILTYDQNRDHLEEWADILKDPEAAKYIWGTAVHWYSSTYEWYPETLTKVHNDFPDKHLLHTEACVDAEVPHWQDDAWYWSKEATDWGYDWAPEEDKHLHPKYVQVYRYARDIIGGLNSWLTGWIDWNMVLDDKGGPNHANNWCVAPVIVKPETDEVYFTPLYYVMSHFSKYIRPGAFRIDVQSPINELMVTACQNPDNSIAVVVLNQTEKPISFNLTIENKNAPVTIPANALQTLVLN